MHLHVVFQGPPGAVTPLIDWCNSIGATYFLTHIALDSTPGLGIANEVIRPTRFWDKTSKAIVHTWEQPLRNDSFRIFKQMTYSMNCAGLTRLSRDLQDSTSVDGVVYYNAYAGTVPAVICAFDLLGQDEIKANFNDATGEVDYSFFITRQHNYDRLSYLWKRNNIPTPHNTPAVVTGKTVWWKWIRLLGLKVTKL